MVDKSLMILIRSEGDEVTFQEAGLTCYIKRHRRPPDSDDSSPEALHLCGYVGVPEGHPLYGKGYDGVDAKVHGGLTFAGKWPKFKGQWFFGFDCAHGGDLIPGWDFNKGGKYRDMEYVKGECKRLAQQLQAVQP